MARHVTALYPFPPSSGLASTHTADMPCEQPAFALLSPGRLPFRPETTRPSLTSRTPLRACAAPSQSPRIARREALALLAAAIAAPALGVRADDAPAPNPLALPPLPYAYNALEPAIDRETMILHHDKHFAKYTEGTNAALQKIPGAAAAVNGDPAKLADLLGNLDSVKDDALRKALRNNGGGYVRSSLFPSLFFDNSLSTRGSRIDACRPPVFFSVVLGAFPKGEPLSIFRHYGAC